MRKVDQGAGVGQNWSSGLASMQAAPLSFRPDAQIHVLSHASRYSPAACWWTLASGVMSWRSMSSSAVTSVLPALGQWKSVLRRGQLTIVVHLGIRCMQAPTEGFGGCPAIGWGLFGASGHLGVPMLRLSLPRVTDLDPRLIYPRGSAAVGWKTRGRGKDNRLIWVVER